MQGGLTLELCVAQYWSEVRDASISLTLTFHSLQPDHSAVTFVRHIHTHTQISFVITVESLNNVTFGTSYSVHYREVPFFGGYKCVGTIGNWHFGDPNLVLYLEFPLTEVPLYIQS